VSTRFWVDRPVHIITSTSSCAWPMCRGFKRSLPQDGRINSKDATRVSATAVTRTASIGVAKLLVIVATILFVGAGSLRFWQAWAFCAVFGLSVTAITIYFVRHDPALITARLKAGPAAEARMTQKIIQSLASVIFLAQLLVPALDRRFEWSEVSPSVVLVANMLVALGLLIIFLVFRENTFTSATIEVRLEQRVIVTGPYRVVRHPMYAGALLLLLAMPVALGSFVGLVVFPPMVLVIVWRLVDEERYLAKNLAGYADYQRKTRCRLMPLVW
jgi:protein-S-isoprenylcysteine O-methyltransferase Ste14